MWQTERTYRENTRRGHTEGTHGGGTRRGHTERTHGGGTWRGHTEGAPGGGTRREHPEGTPGGDTRRGHTDRHTRGASSSTFLGQVMSPFESLFSLLYRQWSDLSGPREDCLAEQYKFCDQVSLVDDNPERDS